MYQARKDKDHSRRLERVRAELVKLKSFALMLVDERQLHIEQIDQQTQKIQDLGQKLQEKEQRLVALTEAAKNDNQKVLRLEAELENRAAEFAQRHEDTSSKLTDEQAQSKQLRLRLAGVTHQIEELEESNKVLQRSEEELRELREKISSGECGNSSVVSELENLRKRVLEMEGKDEEITKAETQCRELRKRLQEEENHSTDLRLEVDKLQKKMAELEKLEGAFSRSKSECAQLHTNLGKEKRAVMDLAAELEKVKTHLKELEALESKFENSELILRDDLMKLKSFTVIWVDERKNMTERLRAEEQKSASLSKKLKEEQSKVTDVTEKLIEESKKLLRLKSDMEVKVTNLAKEKDELKTKLASEEEKREELNRNLSGMKLRMDGLEEKEKNQKKLDEKRNLNDNRVKQLSLEIERLKSRLKQLEVVEGDLMKTEDEYDLLEKKYRTEQDKANALSELLEDMKSQIARNKAIEKGEVESPESELRIRCRMEEERSRELQVDVQALKEKIHELMNKEDQLSQLLVDYSVLQQRCRDEEEKNKGMSQELVELTEELEATRRYSRALRPGVPGRRTTSTAAQTDQLVRESAEDHTAAGFIRQSVLEENHLMSNLRQQSLKRPTVLERYPPASAEVGTRRSWLPWMKKDPNTVNRTSPERSPGQPLHIRVTPDHKTSTATLEITSPRAEDFFSSTTIIPTLGLQKPRITIVPKAATLTPKTKAPDTSGVLDQAKTPITITTISRAKSPDSDHRQSPVSIITVTTTPVAEAGAPQETSAGRTVIKMGADKQPAPARAYNSNIITTEDNKIHIHLGPQFKRAAAGSSSPVLSLKTGGISSESKDTGTVLRSPRQPSTGKTPPSKMSSSITITPVCSTASRTTQSVVRAVNAHVSFSCMTPSCVSK